MAGILLEWSQHGIYDYFEIYRSDNSIDAANLPAPVATDVAKTFYWDANVEQGKEYNYRVAAVTNGVRKISDNKIVRAIQRIGNIPDGIIFSAFLGGEKSALFNSLNPDGDHTPEWESNFDNIVDYSMVDWIDLAFGKTDTRKMNGLIESEVTGLLFEVFTYNGGYSIDNVSFDLEFLDGFGRSMFALRVKGNYSYGVFVSYGSSLTALKNAETSGYPQFQGTIAIKEDVIEFNPYKTINFVKPFNFKCDTTLVSKVRLSNISAVADRQAENVVCYLKRLATV